jgi:hypothetical protein
MGSDYLPGVSAAPGCPMVLAKMSTPTKQLDKPFPEEVGGFSMYTSPQDVLLEITKAHHSETDEIALSIISSVDSSIKDNRSYQLGTANVESVNLVILGIVQNCDESFQEFDIVRLGPKAGQSSREHYRLDRSTVSIYVWLK